MEADKIAAAGAWSMHGRPVLYMPPSGARIKCKALRTRAAVRTDTFGEVSELTDVVELRVVDVPDPQRGAVIRFADGDWRIDGAPDRADAAVVVCPVVPC